MDGHGARRPKIYSGGRSSSCGLRSRLLSGPDRTTRPAPIRRLDCHSPLDTARGADLVGYLPCAGGLP
jgi:hypothetical protein